MREKTARDNYHTTIEVRVKTVDDIGKAWEEIEPATVFVGTTHLPEEVAESMANSNDQVWELRWNWEGSCQGHYHMGAGHYHRTGRMPSHVSTS